MTKRVLYTTHDEACRAARRALGEAAQLNRDFIVTELAPFDGRPGVPALPGGHLWEAYAAAKQRTES